MASPSSEPRPRFHLAIPVADIGPARAFYGETLGLPEGRSDERWVDFDVWGHQLVIHQVDGHVGVVGANPVDGDAVPVPHFGVLLPVDAWLAFADRLTKADVEFVIEPHVRFEGEPAQHHTMFFLDPSGNALEFKAFASDDQVFAR